MRKGHPRQFIKKGFVCCEVGVWKGDLSETLLKRKPSELHLVDPWLHRERPGMWYNIGQDAMDTVHKSVVERFRDEPSVKIHRMPSLETEFPLDTFDWVYIDGDHDYPAVLKDLEHFYPTIKPGGYLCGDDYGWDRGGADGGPQRAVDEFVEKRGLDLILMKDSQFLFRKK